MNTTPQSPGPLDDIQLAIDSGEESQERCVVEEKYTIHNESLLKHWLKTSRENSSLHNLKGKSFKKKHEWVALPSILLPIVFTPIAGVLVNVEGMQYANVAVLGVTGILVGVHNFFDYARKSQKHFEYEAKYADLVTTIMVELSKTRDIRIRADRFIEMVQSKVDSLGANAPLL
jgi:hypothetical protein